ncbi:MAG: glycosyltransferase family 9 protein [Acidobacteria bacterium]|nr:glycosyltransferase family 9 protein [Acidobacteriota bacterium]
MASTSPAEIAASILEACLAGRAFDEAAFHGLAADALAGNPGALKALFAGLIEPLSDRFDPALCLPYAELFSRVVEQALPHLRAHHLVSRYRRVREPRRFEGPDPETVVVLSRVTIGADIAVTSAVLDAMHHRFPRGRVVLAGSRKCWELFEAGPPVDLLEVDYGRTAPLAERLRLGLTLNLDDAGVIVVDPDSRLTQLGLLPVCAEERYYFFESRSAGGDSSATITELAAAWLQATFGVSGRNYVAPAPVDVPEGRFATVSLGTGGNADKLLEDPFESRLADLLCARYPRVIVDQGASEEEALRVRRAFASHSNATLWQGRFAPFAYAITQAGFYAGYDSAGGHAAAAAGTPLLCVFTGAVNQRMFERWKPSGSGPVTVLQPASPKQAIEAAKMVG